MKLINSISNHIVTVGILTKRFLKYRFGSKKSHYHAMTQYSGTSLAFGKKDTIDFITSLYPNRYSRILDVGPGRGIYNKLLKEKGYQHLEAVEIYLPYIKEFKLEEMYDKVYNCDIVEFKYNHYDIVIMGDVIEHLHYRKAQRVIQYAQDHSSLVVVAVPYSLKQIGSQLDGSGDHRQPDLTREVFKQRYPGFELLIDNQQLGVFYSRHQDS